MHICLFLSLSLSSLPFPLSTTMAHSSEKYLSRTWAAGLCQDLWNNPNITSSKPLFWTLVYFAALFAWVLHYASISSCCQNLQSSSWISCCLFLDHMDFLLVDTEQDSNVVVVSSLHLAREYILYSLDLITFLSPLLIYKLDLVPYDHCHRLYYWFTPQVHYKSWTSCKKTEEHI